MSIDKKLLERWNHSPWSEAVKILADPLCDKDQFRKMVETLYPDGGEISVSETHRGRAELLDFRGVSLKGLDLVGADFYKLDLRAACFADADLTGACFETSQIGGANFSGVKSGGDTTFTGGFARESDFADVQFSNCAFDGGDFCRADFTGARFERCDFSASILVGAVFDRAEFVECSFRGAQLSAEEQAAEWFRHSKLIGVDEIIWVPSGP